MGRAKLILVGGFDWATGFVERRLRDLLPLVAAITGEPVELEVLRLPMESSEAEELGYPRLLVFRDGVLVAEELLNTESLAHEESFEEGVIVVGLVQGGAEAGEGASAAA